MSRSKLVGAISFPVLIGGVILLAMIFQAELLATVEAIEQAGVWRFPALLLAQIVQVVIFAVPGEVVQIASGYLLGVAAGTAVSIAGIAAGSTINFLIGRTLGRRFVEVIMSERLRARMEAIAGLETTRLGFFLLFVIPGLPKDILGYVAGASHSIGLAPFLTYSMAGRLPAIVGSAVIGASAAAGRTGLAVTLLVAAAVALLLGVVWRERIIAWLMRARNG